MFPRRKDLFDAWHKAMVAGATVDKPNYGKGSKKTLTRKTKHGTMRRRRIRRIRRQRAKTES